MNCYLDVVFNKNIANNFTMNSGHSLQWKQSSSRRKLNWKRSLFVGTVFGPRRLLCTANKDIPMFSIIGPSSQFQSQIYTFTQFLRSSFCPLCKTKISAELWSCLLWYWQKGPLLSMRYCLGVVPIAFILRNTTINDATNRFKICTILAPSGALIAIPTYYWSTTTHPLFQITPVLNTGLSLSEPLQLYKG